MASMTVSEARANLPALLDRVRDGEEITITRHGHPAAVLVHPDMLRVRRAPTAIAAAERVHGLLVAARAAPLPAGAGAGAVSAARAEELVREIRAGRESR